MIDYHTKDGAPGTYFGCPAGLGTMSTTFCADLHRKSRTKAFILEHKRKECRFCPFGALHAGERETALGSRLYGALLCSRCERHANRLVDGRICVSCYNRERENITGLNAKGNPLKLIRKYYQVPILLAKESEVQLRYMDRVMSMSEGVITVLLKDSDGVIFGWAPSRLLINYAS